MINQNTVASLLAPQSPQGVPLMLPPPPPRPTQLAGDVVPLPMNSTMGVDQLYDRILQSPSGMAKILQMGGLKSMPSNVAVTPPAFMDYFNKGGK